MNKHDARKIAETVTNEQLKEMFDNAKTGIKDWTKISSVNIGMTKGTAWNILAKDFNVEQDYHILAKTNMVREFGEFLPYGLRSKPTRNKLNIIKPVHQDPLFNL